MQNWHLILVSKQLVSLQHSIWCHTDTEVGAITAPLIKVSLLHLMLCTPLLIATTKFKYIAVYYIQIWCYNKCTIYMYKVYTIHTYILNELQIIHKFLNIINEVTSCLLNNYVIHNGDSYSRCKTILWSKMVMDQRYSSLQPPVWCLLDHSNGWNS